MDKKEYGFKEQELKDNFAKALQKTVEEAKPAFEQSIPSAIDHTMSMLNTKSLEPIQQALNEGQGQTNTNERVRVRTMDGLNPFAGTVSNNAESVNNRPMYGNEPYEDIDTNWKTGGYTETLILVGTAVLVILVFMVTYLMLNYFG